MDDTSPKSKDNSHDSSIHESGSLGGHRRGHPLAEHPVMDDPSLDHKVFWPSFLLVLLSSIALILFPKPAGEFTSALKTTITHSLDWLFLSVMLGALIFALWLALGRYGHVKLGDKDEQPEYSNLHWVAMMFTAGIGSGLVIWGFAEPIFYLATPPFGIEEQSPTAVQWAHMYPLFHWGILPWAIYVIPAVPIAFQLYVKNENTMKISSACDGALPQKGRGAIKLCIDIMVVLGIVGGTVTSLGLGVPFISALLAETFGVEDNLRIKICILALWTALVSLSVANGLKRGIKRLADLNMVLAMLAIVFILIAGPTFFILKMSVNSLGLMLNNFVTMATWTDPIDKTGFVQDWTVFYWAWWIAYTAFVGLFIARISRGRTIKQLILGVLGWGSLGTWVFLAVTGGYSLFLDVSGTLNVSEILANNDMSVMVAKILTTLPAPKAVLVLFTVLSIVFLATTIDSAAYIVASVCSKNLRNDQEPQLWSRILWAVLLALMTAGLIVVGGLDAVLAITIICAVPLIPIILLMCISMLKWLKVYTPEP